MTKRKLYISIFIISIISVPIFWILAVMAGGTAGLPSLAIAVFFVWIAAFCYSKIKGGNL